MCNIEPCPCPPMVRTDYMSFETNIADIADIALWLVLLRKQGKATLKGRTACGAGRAWLKQEHKMVRKHNENQQKSMRHSETQ